MTYYVDGFMHGQPTHSGGFTVVDEDNVLRMRRVMVCPDRDWTNNDAELWAVAGGAFCAGPDDTLYSDSEVMVKWWIPRRSAKTRKDLNELIITTAKEIERKNLTLLWCPREQNLAGIYNEKNRSELWKNL